MKRDRKTHHLPGVLRQTLSGQLPGKAVQSAGWTRGLVV